MTRYQAPCEDSASWRPNSTSAPSTGPSIVPIPPTSTMNSMYTLYWMLKTEVGSTYRVWGADRAPDPVRGAELGLQHPVQRVHAVHGAGRRDGHDRGPGARRAGAVRPPGGAVLAGRLVPGHRGRAGGDRDPAGLARAVGAGQRPVRLVPPSGGLPGASPARLIAYHPHG